MQPRLLPMAPTTSTTMSMNRCAAGGARDSPWPAAFEPMADAVQPSSTAALRGSTTVAVVVSMTSARNPPAIDEQADGSRET